MITLQIKNNLTKRLENIKKGLNDKAGMSVEDACRHCSMLWKSKIGFKTGESLTNVYYAVKGTKGQVISPANIKQRGFYLNQFLEGVYGDKIEATPGARNNHGYTLRNGKIFGAGYVAAQEIKPFFKGLIIDRIRGIIK